MIDGAASIAAALFTCAVCGLPAWFTVVAVQTGAAPVWAYGAAAALVVSGAILTFAFVRKGLAGIAPTRARRWG